MESNFAGTAPNATTLRRVGSDSAISTRIKSPNRNSSSSVKTMWMPEEEGGTIDEKILKLKEKLSQCKLEKKLLLIDTMTWRDKERLVVQETKAAEEELKALTEVTKSEISELKEKRKPLQEALATKMKTVRQLHQAFDECVADYEEKKRRFKEKVDMLLAEIEKNNERSQAEKDTTEKLHSELLEKRDILLSFLKTCVKNSELTDDIKPLLRIHYHEFLDTLKTLKTEGDECEKIRKYVHSILKPPFRLDFRSSIYATMLKIFNLFRTMESSCPRINTDSTGKDAEDKHLLRVREDDWTEHPHEA